MILVILNDRAYLRLNPLALGFPSIVNLPSLKLTARPWKWAFPKWKGSSPKHQFSVREGYNSTYRGERIPVTHFCPAIYRGYVTPFTTIGMIGFGAHLVWSLLPGAAPPNESSFIRRLQRLQHGAPSKGLDTTWAVGGGGKIKMIHFVRCFFGILLSWWSFPKVFPETFLNSFLLYKWIYRCLGVEFIIIFWVHRTVFGEPFTNFWWAKMNIKTK